MKEKRYLLVEADILPDVFARVLKAKELLAGGQAKNVCAATQSAGVSRSAFYKYKDSVFRADTSSGIITLTATLLDETGALHALLQGLSSAGAGVLTISQSMPENGTALVSVTVRTDGLEYGPDRLCEELKKQRTVVDIRRSKS